MGELVFKKAQYGIESVHGTHVAATRLYPGTVTVGQDRKVQFISEHYGARTNEARTAIYQHLANPMLQEAHGVFQHLPLHFSIGLKGGVTPEEQTVDQDDYEWDFTPDLEDSNAPDSMTLEYGDDTQAFEVGYVMARRYRISGAVGEDAPVQIETECFGDEVTPVSFTAGLSPISTALQAMVANMAKIYIDATWANLGTTQKTGILRSYDIEILTGVHPKFNGEGGKVMTGHGEGAIAFLATFRFEGNASADAEWDLMRSQGNRAIRLVIEGDQIGTGQKHSLTLDLFGRYETFVPLDGEKDGDNLSAVTFRSLNDLQATPHSLGVKVVTNVASL
ncbi:MAG: hypothetical protein HPY85_06860 [Anaerolineae bacterium]|nr:hypothetical protein [Anaerolineae bacterium]